MYNALNFCKTYGFDIDRLHEIRERESRLRRDKMAREEIKNLKQERIEKGKVSTREPTLVSRNMEVLPEPPDYMKRNNSEPENTMEPKFSGREHPLVSRNMEVLPEPMDSEFSGREHPLVCRTMRKLPSPYAYMENACN